MADVSISEARYVFNVTVNASTTTFLAGNLLAYDGTNWVLADADTPATLYARVVCMASVAAGQGTSTHSLPVCKECVLTDTDAPYTVGAKQYLSGTAGAITETRPSTAGQLRQVVGQAITTSDVHIKLYDLKEVEVPLIMSETSSGEAAFGSRTALDSGNYDGIQMNAQNENTNYHVFVPDGAVSVARAEIWSAQDAATGGGTAPTFAITTNALVDGANWDAVTADSSETGLTLSTNAAGDPIQIYEFSAALNATNITRPGSFWNILVNKSDAGTVATLLFGGKIIFNCV